MSDEIREVRDELLGVDEDGNLIYGDALIVSRRPSEDEVYSQWMEVPDGFLDKPHLRELATKMLTHELDRATA